MAFVNVWTPAKSPGEKLPVLVWIYGAGFNAGATSYRSITARRSPGGPNRSAWSVTYSAFNTLFLNAIRWASEG
jgi:hypothetical protein